MSDSEQLPEGDAYPEWDEEAGGGPVKTFLEHLEDLRWTLIKCVSVVLISMLFCLVASNLLVSFLTWPLKHGAENRAEGKKDVALFLGETRLGIVPEAVATNVFPWELKNTMNRVNVVFKRIGTNVVWSNEPAELEVDEAPSWSTGVQLKNYSPIGAFIVAFQLMLYGGLVISSPFVIFFIGQFVLPALHIHEKKFLYQTAGFGSLLFILGVAFCYFIVMQIALMATVQFSQWMGFGADEWRAEDYISFVCKLMLAMGLSFQLPVVLLTMVKVGFLDQTKLVRFRPYWIVINLAICAVITPTGDPFTMVLMALPLQFLYELSIFIAKFWEKRDKADQESLEKTDTES
jgi:sec-independent protein translocase protein TatC